MSLLWKLIDNWSSDGFWFNKKTWGGGAFGPLKMRPKGGVIVAPLETLGEIERGHVLATGVTCLCIYIHNYVSLKKELERQDHGGVCPKGDA